MEAVAHSTAHFAELRERGQGDHVLPAPALDELRNLLGDRLTTARQVRDHHGTDISSYPVTPPDAVAFPLDASEVVAIVGICARHRVPMIPFGIGTSVEGHVLATRAACAST